MSRHLVTGLDDPEGVPYFLWSEDISGQEFISILRGERGAFLQHAYMGRLLREARLSDIWQVLTVHDILRDWRRIKPHLGKRLKFWEFLLKVWRAHGLV